MLGRQRDRAAQLGDRVRIFAADVDVAPARADRVGGNGHALDQLEGIALHQHPVGKGAAVALVGVADHVFAPLRPGDGLPLDPRRKPRPAASAQARLQHFGDDFGRRHLARAGERGPAAGCRIVLKAERAGPSRPRESQALLAGDEGVIGNRADGLAAGAGEDRRNVLRRGRAKARAVNLDQRLQPVHAPARDALHRAASRSKGDCHRIRAAGQRKGIVRNPDHGHSDFTSAVSLASSSRAWSLSPTRAAGPLLHSPRQ
jgi:hypothetical protein